MTSKGARGARTAILASLVFGASVASHQPVGFGGDHLTMYLLCFAVALVSARLILDRRRRPLALFALILASQLLLHVVLTVAVHHGAESTPGLLPSLHALAGHAVTALVVVVLLREFDVHLRGWLQLLIARFLRAPILGHAPVATGLPRVCRAIPGARTSIHLATHHLRGPPVPVAP